MAHQYCLQNNKKCTLWLDKASLAPLVPLFEAQPCVEAVELKDGIEHYNCGGQPYHFGMKTDGYQGHEVYHLGMKSFPQRQITLQTLVWVPLLIDRSEIAETVSLEVGPVDKVDRLVLHGTFKSHHTGVPSFWKFLFDHAKELEELFQEIVFVGTKPEIERAAEVYPPSENGAKPKWSTFDDGGNFLELAKFVAASRCVIAAGSSVATLGGALKIPTLRIHDPIGDHPKVIWSNLGHNQMNETETTLRTKWPEFREAWAARPAEATA